MSIGRHLGMLGLLNWGFRGIMVIHLCPFEYNVYDRSIEKSPRFILRVYLSLGEHQLEKQKYSLPTPTHILMINNMTDYLTELNTLRNNIDFATMSQFFHTFQSAYSPWPASEHTRHEVFQTEDLERMILDVLERPRLEELIVKMLRLISRNRFINDTNWQTYWMKEFDKRESVQPNPFRETENYYVMPLETRVHLLYLLCEWQLDYPERLRDHLESEEDAVQWRVEPVGYDRKGCTFWLFDDNRLYKQTPKPVHKAKSKRRSKEDDWIPWQLVCRTPQEWKLFPNNYKDSTNAYEKHLYSILVDELLPKILPILEEHEKEKRKQEAIIHRKRSTRILMKELQHQQQVQEKANTPPERTIKKRTTNTSKEEWTFDCVCGLFGYNLDDGTPMIACEECGTWQHIECLKKNGSLPQLETLDFISFKCRSCQIKGE
ncbi:hypothetical protein BDB01DRAFT_898817 [Pilobolus umbonatus]|nr:hypothetical protein BDB01DRAFT_898817 [Pilobolus umbonatus]